MAPLFQGVFAPVTTPFRGEDVDLDGLCSNLTRYGRTGLAGVVVLGSTGEAALLTDAECSRVIDAARAVIPRAQRMIAGTGRESTAATIDATRRAAAAGADAVLVRVPSYFRAQLDGEVFVRHFERVADASPVPVLLYNAVVFTGVTLDVDTVHVLAAHPNILGLKDSGSPLERLIEFVQAAPRDFSVLTGSALALHAALTIGASGAVIGPACVAPDLFARLFELAAAGRHDDAQELQRRLSRLSRLLDGVPATKAALDAAGFVGGLPRPPLLPAPDHIVASIRMELSCLPIPV